MRIEEGDGKVMDRLRLIGRDAEVVKGERRRLDLDAEDDKQLVRGMIGRMIRSLWSEPWSVGWL